MYDEDSGYMLSQNYTQVRTLAFDNWFFPELNSTHFAANSYETSMQVDQDKFTTSVYPVI